MKILTINTHSLIENNYEKKCQYFVDAVIRHNPDIICMQEVNQSKFSNVAKDFKHFATGKIPIKIDNHALKIYKMLKDNGILYHFSWLGIKNGYKIFEEGLATFSKEPVTDIKEILLTKKDDFANWKTRKALSLSTFKKTICNVHMGWWEDSEEPFLYQFEQLNKNLSGDEIFLMGDFNSPASEQNKGYSTVIKNGWFDTYTLANERDSGITVKGKIAGWKSENDKRIDFIFTNKEKAVKSSKVIFNGENEKIISDHFGVIIEI